jgi:3-phytase
VRVGEGGFEAAPMAVVGGVPDTPPAEDGLAGPQAAVLYRCAWDAGYWIAAEAEPADGRTVFRVLDRVTREPVGRFRGEVTAGTDALWLSTVPIPDFPAGALYAVHDDASVTAFDWRHVAGALGLRADCASDGK